MLTTLRIKNLALVEDLTLELQPGYNVITGETGAGKVHPDRRFEPGSRRTRRPQPYSERLRQLLGGSGI